MRHNYLTGLIDNSGSERSHYQSKTYGIVKTNRLSVCTTIEVHRIMQMAVRIHFLIVLLIGVADYLMRIIMRIEL